jgi:hypothetical protein
MPFLALSGQWDVNVAVPRLPDSNWCSIQWSMSTKDQLLYSALHGTAKAS